MSNDGGKEKKKKPRDKLVKVVIRRLPPYMTWEELSEQLNPLPHYEYVSFVPADLSFIPHAFSRCYFAFTDENATIDFSNRFNRYVFVDKKGHESAAIVELAIYQRIPKKNREDIGRDARCGVIEEEVEYRRFVDELESSRNVAILTMEEQLRNVSLREASTKAGCVQETPLTQFLMKQAEEKFKKTEEKRRVFEEKRRERKKAELVAKKERERPERTERPERPERPARKEKDVISFTNSAYGGRHGRDSPIEHKSSGNVDAVMKKLGINVPSSAAAESPREAPRERHERPERVVRPKKTSPPLKPKKERPERPPRSDRPPREPDDKKKKGDRPEREIYRPGQRSRARAAEIAATNGGGAGGP